ncbi:hydrogenase maturation protein HypF [Sulfurifustis variabilis]|uniref:Carbamoyltransferase HypF n=1 Tax=Sulfurifustis variabilis TaxID=1675686 RepID=A0A1B4VC54_9GAMM|nr:carbamoyltransferase HypF [Sulfurifustis variabilis]BAU48741.1 hydrogenase maturation protein HypF [Sulfurifustis variabilis]
MREPPPSLPTPGVTETRRWLVAGRVQGVGFRPFVHRLARAHELTGWVQNRMGQVEIVGQGTGPRLDAFARALLAEAPPLARPRVVRMEPIDAGALVDFEIRASEARGAAAVHVPPDYYACPDCVREMRDPNDRRYRYPFINCTQCGPRYTLIARLPYDRPNTSMAGFALCPECRREYEDPLDRRFHAEPVACPTCGPRLRFRESGADSSIDEPGAAFDAALRALQDGRILAVKGVGGYHLMCDARSEQAVARLRRRKPRPHKPLAVMFPPAGADGLDALRRCTRPEPAELALLGAPMRPIVLVRKRPDLGLADAIAPGLAEIGAFLPYSPLHHLLLQDFGEPLVATSANVSGEPVLTDSRDVESRLAHVADGFLHHDRDIVRPADDPVYRVIAGEPRPLRLGRGIAPLELDLPFRLARPVLATGGHMKNAVALAWDERVVVSPHIGDLGTPRSLAVFEQVLADLQALYGVRAERVVHDAHPYYASTRWARRSGLPAVAVFHHRAHAAALAAEHPRVARWLVFTWDGVGYGEDGTLWGGEALLGAPGRWRRVASFRPFRLPGGEKAGREPWRSAAALSWETGAEWPALPEDAGLLHAAWCKGLNTPSTSAVGRLFDAAAAFTGLNLRSSFEGQGPMMLEAAATDADALPLPLIRDADGLPRTDWAALVPMLLDATRPVAERAGRFHASLARALVDQALRVREEHGNFAVGLTGGVFQNRRLAELAARALEAHGFDAHLPERTPCNDGGLCYGQVIEAADQRFS